MPCYGSYACLKVEGDEALWVSPCSKICDSWIKETSILILQRKSRRSPRKDHMNIRADLIDIYLLSELGSGNVDEHNTSSSSVLYCT